MIVSEVIENRKIHSEPIFTGADGLLDLYEDILRIAFVQHHVESALVANIMEQYRDDHKAELTEFHKSNETILSHVLLCL